MRVPGGKIGSAWMGDDRIAVMIGHPDHGEITIALSFDAAESFARGLAEQCEDGREMYALRKPLPIPPDTGRTLPDVRR